ncbi:DUF1583 domain-containing protein [Neorhodopirellula pilleata]|uniref:3-keto-disaccharide hydrolase domain-containing protein n=1 Tax=Neorhodopirellula pilleata TaxID=2714738 RepID=A0A5C6APN1_9BACT|nr:DUF1583 domain-containing protein [Neorhodopirellula pilleata]TWU01660.1 hypothetical protein Pla100_13950 [Neorhodopirellula pilleata]
MMAIRFLSIGLLAITVLFSGATSVCGTEPTSGLVELPTASDHAAMNAIFGDSVLAQNSRQIIVQARNQTPEERYSFLSRWVLPGRGHDFRIDGTIDRSLSDHDDMADPFASLVDYPESTWLLCPARELVQLADQMGRLGELRVQVSGLSAISQNGSLGRSTLLTLIDIAELQRDRVAEQLAERFTPVRDEHDPHAVPQWWSDLIVLWSAMENPATGDLVIEDFFGAFNINAHKTDPRLDVISDYLGLLFRIRSHSPQLNHSRHAAGTAAFDTFSSIDARTHARGNPLPRYYFDEQGAVKLSGHESDYLAFRIPLQGSFETVSEFATHTGAFSDLMVAGIAVRPTENLRQVSARSLANISRQQSIDPPFQPTGSLSRVRAISNDAGTTHSFNGRECYLDSHARSSAPWVAVRSWRRAQSKISELMIAGSPTIPNEINLIEDASLRGWASYYDSESNEGHGSWKARTDDSGQWMLTSERTFEPRGCFAENLLYYVRPLVWDATVSYEFEYREGTAAVHPCIGRSVFLIRSDGVALHRLTDGRFESSDLRSDNAEPLSPPSPEQVVRTVLKEGWNQAELRITSDRVELWLNDQPVAEQTTEPGESRTFGLFHYQDQTRASVRNVRLAGEWPRELPSLEAQPLASQQVAALDAAAENLDATWTHDFQHGAPQNLFIYDGDASRLTQQPEGVRIERLGNASTLHLNFAGQIEGDFDIVLAFKDLKIGDQEPTWHCGVGLAVTVDNSEHDRIDIVRRRDRLNRHHHIVLARNRVNRFGGVDWVKDTTRIDESVSGRLRLIRQGNSVHGLYADGDSDVFRYLDHATIEGGTIAPGGLRLHTVAGKDMTCEMVWVRLEIRADAIKVEPEPMPQAYRLEPLPDVAESGPSPVPAPVSAPIPASTQTKSLPGRLYDSLRSLFP